MPVYTSFCIHTSSFLHVGRLLHTCPHHLCYVCPHLSARLLQAEYMRLKSIQRFTEGTAAMERAYNAGAFTAQLAARPQGGRRAPFRVASLGGGPGFELVAVREFCASHLPNVEPQLLSLDLQVAATAHLRAHSPASPRTPPASDLQGARTELLLDADTPILNPALSLSPATRARGG